MDDFFPMPRAALTFKKTAGLEAAVSAAPSTKAKTSGEPRATGKLDPASPKPRRDLAPARIADLLDRLARTYPHAECALLHRSPFELLIATILSAQTTDAGVNLATPALFAAYPTPAAMAAAPLPVLEELIRRTGFYRSKAKSIQGAAQAIHERFHDEVPRTVAELITVPGAARKTANVVLGVAFGLAEGVVVDTHVQRLSKRLGLTTEEDPKKIEQDLMKRIPRDRWIAFSHELIHHGRQVCVARKPRCAVCPFETTCWAPDKTYTSH